TPHSFPDASDQGALVHEILQQVYLCAGSSSLLNQITQDQVRTICTTCIEQNFQRFPAAFRDAQVNVVYQPVWNWIEFDRARTFDVDALEQTYTITLQGVEFALRLDRVDRVNDSPLVIDYKTGRHAGELSALSTLSALEERGASVQNPQLAAYVIASNARGAMFARLGARPRVTGIASSELSLTDRGVDQVAADSWSEQVGVWHAQLNDLVGEFVSGYASVKPRSASLCKHCHLSSFCRIERSGG
ncbi:MAG: PD-(D/E)XK nuclease family protein, partial [Proteobacteria bacterium]|nr:PD-(D/E)XK nuclease family protein [Pseudomonadota bacterium]